MANQDKLYYKIYREQANFRIKENGCQMTARNNN